MKIHTTKEQLSHAIILAERLTEKKESLPVISCIYIECGRECCISATNLEAGIEITIVGDISEKGIIAVPASVLSQTIRSISSDKITLTTEDNNLLIESRGTKTLIKSIPHDDFPKFSTHIIKDKKNTISRKHFLHGIEAVSYAASPSMIRPELGSVYISIKSGTLLCVATDSFRLAEKKIPAAAGKNDIEILLPIKHTSELIYILEHIETEGIDLVVDDSQIIIFSMGVRYMSRVVDNTFPNYKEIIPKSFNTEVIVLKNDFIEMLRKARVFSGTDQHVGLHVYPKKKIFSATARSADVGEMSDSIDAALSGEDIDINFHIGYLFDCLSSIESDSIVLEFSSAGKPLIIRGVSDSSFIYLVMPLNH